MIQKILKILFSLAIIFNVNIALAASIDHFILEVNPTKVAIGESVDLTIKAVDKNDEVVKDYEGSILIFSESDKLAEFPKEMEDNSYTFKKSDEGVVKFENAVRFSKAGKNDIHVYDLSDDTESIFGIAEVNVIKGKNTEDIKIEIVSPENGITIGENKINISGKTAKNHQIKIILNNKKNFLAITNRDGLFEKEIEDLEKGKNTIKAYVLDADSKEIGESKEIIVNYDPNMINFNKVIIEPKGDIEENSKIEATIYATKDLEEVSILLNDGINILKQDNPGIYKGEFLAPNKEGEYNLSVKLKDELGHKLIKNNIYKLKIIPKLKAPEPKPQKPKLKKDKCENGDYSGNVFDGKCGEKPINYEAPLDLSIKNLKVVKLKTKSILTWNKVEQAKEYEIYKKTKDGNIELVDTTTQNKYTIPMVGEEIKNEYFAVKAIAEKEMVNSENNNEKIKKKIKGDLSEAVKVQTGPKEILLIILALLIGGIGIFLFNRSKA